MTAAKPTPTAQVGARQTMYNSPEEARPDVPLEEVLATLLRARDITERPEYAHYLAVDALLEAINGGKPGPLTRKQLLMLYSCIWVCAIGRYISANVLPGATQVLVRGIRRTNWMLRQKAHKND